ncbi:MAG: DNA mismatch repair protein MutS [Bacilli bacterium]
MNIDMNKLTPMMKQYWSIKNRYLNTILLYRLGDFYEMFFDDAIIASKVLGIALTSRNAGLEEKAKMCGVPYHSSEAYIKKLIAANYKVAICEQLEDPSSTKGLVKRDVVQIISPGTSIDDQTNYNYLMFIDHTKDNYYYYALCDLATGKLKALKTTKTKEQLYNTIKAYNIKEVVLYDHIDTSIFDQLIKSYVLHLSFTNESKAFNHQIITKIQEEYQPSFQNLLDYIQTSNNQDLDYYLEIEYDNVNVMHLSYTSKLNLELTKNIKTNEKYGSLYWFLDKTKTAMGSRLLKEYIEHPFINKDTIIFHQNIITSLIEHYFILPTLNKELNNVYDIARIVGKLGQNKASIKDLNWLKKSLQSALNIKNALIELENENIKILLEDYNSLDELILLIDSSIYEEHEQDYIIKNGINQQLDDYLDVLENSSQWLVSFEQEQRVKTGIKNLKVKYNKVFGYYIEISNGNVHYLKDNNDYQLKQTLANAHRYINDELKKQEELILEAQANYYDLEQTIIIDIKQQVKNHIKALQVLAHKIAFIDVMYSLALVSNETGFTKPTFNDEFKVSIKNSFHPIIKEINNDITFITNDYYLSQDIQTLIITGPNMGGKSTYMRQLSIIVLLAQLGCYVPATHADLMIFTSIYTRIGASDDLINGQSTFMVEMSEASEAINNANEYSLILFDEIGRGTATYDGMALACSMLEYINIKTKAKLLFSTHYHELTSLEQQYPMIKNYHASVIENKDEIQFTYKVLPGSIDKSYGIHVAMLANLPQNVILRANQLLKSYESNNHNLDLQVEYIEVKDEKATKLIAKLQKLNLDQLTPLAALNYLNELKKEVGE